MKNDIASQLRDDDEDKSKFDKIGDNELKLMLKIGDPGPDFRYEGKEVDFEQFMIIMEKAGVYKPSNVDELSTYRGEFGGEFASLEQPPSQRSLGVSNDPGPYQGNW